MAKTVKLVTSNDFSELFTLENNVVDIKRDKLLQLVKDVASEVKEYELEVVSPGQVQIVQDTKTKYRKLVAINGAGAGMIALDFICRSNRGRVVAFRMPEGAPLPTRSITTNAGGGILWWDAGSREIIFSQIENNTRVVLNLSGFFA